MSDETPSVDPTLLKSSAKPADQPKQICYKHRNNLFIANTGPCKRCDAHTTSGSFNLCPKCATATNTCAFCNGPLDAIKPPTPPGAKLKHLVALNAEHYREHEGTPPDRVTRSAEGPWIIEQFKQALAALLAERGQPADAIEITNEMTALMLVVVSCTPDIAAAIDAMPGVSVVDEVE